MSSLLSFTPEQASTLAKMFADNFKPFENDVAPSVKAAGPKA